MPEAIFLASLSIWFPQVRLESITIPRDLAVETWFMRVPLMVKVGVSVRVLSYCLEPISLNSVLVIFSVSSLAIY